MSSPFVGEIRMFGGNFAPAGWAFCNGQTIAISQNDTLFNLIGTTYGGDGQQTFALPNLQSRVPIHQGQGSGIPVNFVIGEMAGVESVTLTTNQMPIHTQSTLGSTSVGSTAVPSASEWLATATAASITPYGTDNPQTALSATSISQAGGSQPHDNMQPYLCINFIISLFGIFPSPN